jgi:glycosyltransferase involved in cell wall biosynthesis
MIDIPSFFGSLPDDLPVVWTLHDMNPFTGGCHFSSGCQAFQSACGNCPQIARPHQADLSQQIIRLKQTAVRNKNLHVVAPSQWLTEQARKSSVFSTARSFQTIPYGLDTSSLTPHCRTEARQNFQLPANSFVLGFGADSLSNRRKGFAELFNALQQVRAEQPIIAVVFGAGELPALDLPSVKVVPVGFVRSPEQLARLYSAMNVFVLPSLEDNLPQTGLEAMACGTPVIAFDAGGIPDFVLPNRTGLLAKTGDAADLARQIQSAIDHPETLERWGRQGRQLMLERFNCRSEAKAYAELYYRVLEQQNKHFTEAA